MKEISIKEIEGFRIGNAENLEAGTGMTVILTPKGTKGGVDVRGGGPASRDTQLLNPLMTTDEVNAVVLSGGSAFGLDSAGGVMQRLEEEGIGFDVGVTVVPIVCQADIFDLSVGRADVRPDKAMGYEATVNAEKENYQDGNFGVGTGASLGKARMDAGVMKSGVGSYAVQVGELKVGVVVVVNAFGDVYDWETGKELAGLRAEDGETLLCTEDFLYDKNEVWENKFVGNTTLAVVITNGNFTKSQLCKISGMAHDGMARAIRPVHSSCDGDAVFALGSGKVSADMDMVGALAARVLSEAIKRAVTSAEPAYGYPSWKSLK